MASVPSENARSALRLVNSFIATFRMIGSAASHDPAAKNLSIAFDVVEVVNVILPGLIEVATALTRMVRKGESLTMAEWSALMERIDSKENKLLKLIGSDLADRLPTSTAPRPEPEFTDPLLDFGNE